MNTIRVRFDFYRVKHLSTNAVNFGQILDDLIKLSPNDAQAKIDGEACLISKSEKISGTFTQAVSMLFTKIRMDNLPQKAKASGERSPLDLDDDEGLGEDVAISYCQDLNIVAIQKNIHSLSANNILRLIKEVDPRCEVEFLPVLKEDALERFLKLKCLKKIRLKIDGTKDLSFLKDQSLNNAMNLQNLLSAPYLECTWSVGRRKKEIPEILSKFIEKIAILIKNQRPEAICNLEITGRETEIDPSITIDLLEDRLIEQRNIPINDNGRSVDIQQLLKAAAGVIFANYAELTKK